MDRLLPYDSDRLDLALDLDFWRRQRPVGISFLLRVREDERTLAFALESLLRVPFPYEVLIGLNSPAPACIALAGQFYERDPRHFRVFHYPLEVSLPGLANWVTPVNSAHSFSWLSNWLTQQSSFGYSWRFDADEILTEPAKDAIRDWLEGERTRPDPVGAWYLGKQYIHQPYTIGIEPVLFRNDLRACHKQGAWEAWDFRLNRKAEPLTTYAHLFYQKYKDVVPWFYRDESLGAQALRAKYEELRLGVPHWALVPRGALNHSVTGPLRRLPHKMEYIHEIRAICLENRKRANQLPDGPVFTNENGLLH